MSIWGYLALAVGTLVLLNILLVVIVAVRTAHHNESDQDLPR